MSSTLSLEEKKRINSERQRAVRDAWKAERVRVENGQGTRDWSVDEQRQIIERGAVEGYQGHHMKSVREYPEEAGNLQNIQFLNEEEHLYGAHQGSYHNSTNGYYNPDTGEMESFHGAELRPVPTRDLSESYVTSQKQSSGSSYNDMGSSKSSFDSIENNASNDYGI